MKYENRKLIFAGLASLLLCAVPAQARISLSDVIQWKLVRDPDLTQVAATKLDADGSNVSNLTVVCSDDPYLSGYYVLDETDGQWYLNETTYIYTSGSSYWIIDPLTIYPTYTASVDDAGEIVSPFSKEVTPYSITSSGWDSALLNGTFTRLGTEQYTYTKDNGDDGIAELVGVCAYSDVNGEVMSDSWTMSLDGVVVDTSVCFGNAWPPSVSDYWSNWSGVAGTPDFSFDSMGTAYATVTQPSQVLREKLGIADIGASAVLVTDGVATNLTVSNLAVSNIVFTAVDGAGDYLMVLSNDVFIVTPVVE